MFQVINISTEHRDYTIFRSVRKMTVGLPLLAVPLLITMVIAQIAGAQKPVNESESTGLSVSLRDTIDLGMGHDPVEVYVPSSYESGSPTPLIVLLHGYTSSGDSIKAYWGMEALADEFGFLLLAPTGRTSAVQGITFWSATTACCNFEGDADNDVDYIIGLVNQMKTDYNVDDRRVYLAGHSNGGFMSYRMACENPETFAAIASLAGSMYEDPTDCANSEPVHVLQIHGTIDDTIEYYEPAFTYPELGGYFPGAIRTVEQWAALNGCEVIADTSSPNIDLEGSLAGDETTVTRYKTSCDFGGSTELWTINGGSHVPTLSTTFGRQMVEWLYAHPKRPLEAWIDFEWTGIQNGLEDYPFNSLEEILAIMAEVSAVKIKGDTGESTTPDTLTVNQQVTLQSISGPIQIGVSTAPKPGPDTKERSGFTTRE